MMEQELEMVEQFLGMMEQGEGGTENSFFPIGRPKNKKLQTLPEISF